MQAAILQTFAFYLDDDRYAVPTLVFAPAEDEVAAMAVAQRFLNDSAHHRGVEVCFEGERVDGLGSLANRRVPADARAQRAED